MKKISASVFLVLCSYVFVMAQISNRTEALKIFIDCPQCDLDHIRNEITFVNYVREAKEADVLIITTSQNTGSKGTLTSVFFYGQKNFNQIKDTLTFHNMADDTEDIFRQRINKCLKLGLISFVSKTPLADFIDIVYNPSEEGLNEVVSDKWRGWVFQTSLNGWGSAQKTYNTSTLYSSLNIERVTANFKTENYFNHKYAESNFNYEDFNYKNVQRSYSFTSNNVFSLTEHWSAGIFTSTWSSVYSNMQFQLSLRPAVEYNIYPYADASTKQLRFSYSLGPVFNQYNDTTIFNKMEELLFRGRLSITTEFVKPWGRIWVWTSYANYLHDFSLNSLNINSNLSWRIVKGLELNYSLGYGIIHDQISLTKGGATQEELLLQQKELKTDFNFWASFGISYTFGDIYNNIVNTRFGNN